MALTQSDLPALGADWDAYARLAVTFDAVAAFGSIDAAGENAGWAFSRWQRSGQLPCRIEELRACVWFEHRRWRFLGRDPDGETRRYCAAVVRDLRRLV